MQITQQPLFVKDKESIKNRVKKFVIQRRKEGYTVRSKILFFTPLYHRSPKKVKVLISAYKVEPFGQAKMAILRGDGSWK